VESTPWRRPEDALRFTDIAEEVACAVTTTAAGNLSATIKPLDTARVPGLADLLRRVEDAPDTTLRSIETGLAAPGQETSAPIDPYALITFDRQTSAAALSAVPGPDQQPVIPPLPATPPTPAVLEVAHLVSGQSVVVPDPEMHEVLVTFASSGADADLTVLLTRADGKVARDEDFVFYNQPTAVGGAVRLAAKQAEEGQRYERVVLSLAALPGRSTGSWCRSTWTSTAHRPATL
jgi:TerD domain-containing protein